MNNKEFISALSQRTGYSQEDTQRLVSNLVTAMGNEFMNGESVNIARFRNFRREEAVGAGAHQSLFKEAHVGSA